MADETLSSELELDIGPALSSVDQLGSDVEAALFRGADSFSEAMSAAIAAVPEVEIEPDVTAVDPAISDAVSAADTEAEVTADASSVTGDVDAAVSAVDGEVPVDATGTEAVTADIDAAVGAADGTVQIDADTAVAIAMIQAIDEQVPDISVTVDADTEEAQAAVDALSTSVEDASGSLDTGSASATNFAGATSAAGAASDLATGSAVGLGSAVGEIGGTAGVAVGVVSALGAGIFAMYNEAVEATGASQRFKSTLGDMADEVENLTSIQGLNTNLGELALQLGSDDDKVRSVAANMFDLAQASGISRDAASEFSQELVAMGARAVARKPELGDLGDVTEALSTALVRGGRFASKFGLDLNQADINARALNDTHKTSTSELSFVEKAMAGASLATEKYGGNLEEVIARGSDNAIIKQRRLSQTIRENIEALGMPLVAPIFEVIEAAIPATQVAGELLSALAQGAIPLLTAALEVATPGLQVIADILTSLPTPVLAAGAAFLTMRATLGPLFASDGMIFQGGKLLGRLSTSLDTTGGRFAVAAAGATLAATGFQQAGEGGAQGTIGILEMAGGGALLGASLGAMTGVGAPVGAALGAIGGAAVGVAKNVLSSGESLDEYRQKFEKLGNELDNVSARGALNKFTDQLGDIDHLAIRGGNGVRLITDELTALGSSSPAAAQKVVRAFIEMREESGKPLSHAAIDELHAAVDKGSAIYQKHVVAQQQAAAANASEAAAAQSNAQAQTNANAVKQAAADATKAHSDALAHSTSAYQATTLAAQTQAAADANSAAAANQAALASRSVGDAAAAVAQEQLSYTLAVDGSVAAVGRYLYGAGTAKEATDAEAGAVSALRTELTLLTGNYYGAVGSTLALEQQTLTFNATLDKQGGTLGANRAEVLSSEQALVGMGNAANSASIAAAQNGQSVLEQITPLQTYQGELETVKNRLIESGDVGGAAFVQSLQDANQRAIANLQASAPGMAGAADSAVGAGVAAAGNQGGNMASTVGGVGRQGVGGLGAGLSGAPDVASGAVNAAASAAGLAGANMHNIGYGIGASLSEGIGDGIIANDGYVQEMARRVVNDAESAARAAAESHSPSRLFARLGRDLVLGAAIGMDGASGEVASAARGMVGVAAGAVGMLDGASSAWTPGISGGGMRGGTTTIVFDVDVHGVSDPALARKVGEEFANGAVGALTERGVVSTARLG